MVLKINKIKELISSIKSEDFASDKIQRDEALKLYNTISNNFKNYRWKILSTSKMLALYIDIDKQINPEHKIRLILLPKTYEDKVGAGAWSPASNAIYLVSDFPEFSLEYLREPEVFQLYLDSLHNDFKYKLRDVFVHEFIHYLDDSRLKDDIGKVSRGYKLPNPEDNYKSYYSQPSEYNAFIQGILTRLDAQLARNNEVWAKNVFGLDFETFLNYALHIAKDYPLTKEGLTDTYYKKARKRLYSYYYNNRKELGLAL